MSPMKVSYHESLNVALLQFDEIPASPFARAVASSSWTSRSGRYCASHICSRIHSSSSSSSVGISFSFAKPSFRLALMTFFAMRTLTSRTSVTSGSKPELLPCRTGAVDARAFTAATIKGGDSRQVRLRIAPRPIPGKATELLHSAGEC